MNQFWIKALPPFIRTRLEGRVHLQRILANTGWLFADRFLRLGVGLVVGAWVARYLGPEQFGLYSYVIAFVGLFGLLATLGLDNIVVRDLVRDPSSKDEILGTTFALKLTGGIVALCATVAVIPLFRPGEALTQGLAAIIAAGMVFQALDAIDFWFQSQVQSKYTVYARNTAFGLITIVKVGLILAKAPLLAFAWAGLAEIGLASIGLAIAYRAQGQSLPAWRIRLQTAKSLLRASWPLMLSTLAIWIYVKIDQLMLGTMLGDGALGIYSAAVRLSEVWYFIPMAIVNSVFPTIVGAKRVDESVYYSRLQSLFVMMVVLAYTIAAIVTISSPWLVMMLYGQAYAGAALVLAVHIWAAVGVFLGVAKETWLVAEGLTKYSLGLTATGAAINVALNLFLIPTYGPLGAAIATLVAYSLAGVFACFLFAPTRRIAFMMCRSLVLMR